MAKHRALLFQRHFDPSIGQFACMGPWVPAWATSTVTACTGHTIAGAGVEVR